MCIENIFFKTKKLQMKILLEKSQIALRKCKGNNRNLTAGHLKQEGALERLVHLDEGYKFYVVHLLILSGPKNIFLQ